MARRSDNRLYAGRWRPKALVFLKGMARMFQVIAGGTTPPSGLPFPSAPWQLVHGISRPGMRVKPSPRTASIWLLDVLTPSLYMRFPAACEGVNCADTKAGHSKHTTAILPAKTAMLGPNALLIILQTLCCPAHLSVTPIAEKIAGLLSWRTNACVRHARVF